MRIRARTAAEFAADPIVCTERDDAQRRLALAAVQLFGHQTWRGERRGTVPRLRQLPGAPARSPRNRHGATGSSLCADRRHSQHVVGGSGKHRRSRSIYFSPPRSTPTGDRFARHAAALIVCDQKKCRRSGSGVPCISALRVLAAMTGEDRRGGAASIWKGPCGVRDTVQANCPVDDASRSFRRSPHDRLRLSP